MPKFSKKSRENLSQCHEDLQRLFNEVIKYYDCSVICGHRGKEAQNKAFVEFKSKLKYPNSKHNKKPSLAADVVPYPIDWYNIERFANFAGFVKGIACMMGIEIICGADWITLRDYPHFELVGE